jgi:cytochrome c-type biogenesis protein CcmE
MLTQMKLMIGALVCALATAYLAYLGASQSWQYYMLVDECVQESATIAGQRLRVSGHVAPESLVVQSDRSQATFTLKGQRSSLIVSCRGPLPDNLAADMDVVVEGTLTSDGLLRGEKVLTRCASKYQAEVPTRRQAAQRRASGKE